jgi:hypothetical protein
MKLVIIESPFAGKGDTAEERARNTERNKRYLQRCVRDCILRGESPYASHRMLTAALDDMNPEERKLGIDAGFAWREKAAKTVVYTDHGISGGMKLGIEHAEKVALYVAHSIEYREIGAEPEAA